MWFLLSWMQLIIVSIVTYYLHHLLPYTNSIGIVIVVLTVTETVHG